MFIQALFLAAASAAEIDASDLSRFTEAAIAHGRPREEALHHAWDAFRASEAMFPRDPGGMFCLYSAVAWGEKGFGFKAELDSDGKVRAGPIQMDAEEVCVDAARLGCDVTSPRARGNVWGRFKTDKTFAVWVCVHRLVTLVSDHEGDVFMALAHHNGGPKHGWRVEYSYVPGICYRHFKLFSEWPPERLPRP